VYTVLGVYKGGTLLLVDHSVTARYPPSTTQVQLCLTAHVCPIDMSDMMGQS
jgi:hypothetical protein